MQFGQDLRGQLTDVSERLCNHTAFLGEVREMVKERAQAEKEYASRLEALARKYTVLRDKRAAALVVSAGAAQSLDQATLSLSISRSTTLHAYDTYLEEMSTVAQNRYEYANLLASEVGDRLHALALRKEEARKRHMQFASKLLQERAKNIAETTKARSKWVEAVEEAENSRVKMERRTDERSYAVRQYETNLEDMYNYKNLYIIALRVCNDQRKKYAHEDMPTLLNVRLWDLIYFLLELQGVEESRTIQFQETLRALARLELSSLDQCKVQLQGVMEAVDEMSPRQEVHLFTETSKVQSPEDPDVAFEGCVTDEDDQLYVRDAPNRTYLVNLIRKSKELSLELEPEITANEQKIKGQEERTKSFLSTDGGDTVDITMDANDLRNQHILDSERLLILLRSKLRGHRVEVEQVRQALGGCGYHCHSKCEMKVDPQCPGEMTPSSISSSARELLTPQSMPASISDPAIKDNSVEDNTEIEGIQEDVSLEAQTQAQNGKEDGAGSGVGKRESISATSTHLPSPSTPDPKKLSDSQKKKGNLGGNPYNGQVKEGPAVYRRPSIPSNFRQHSSKAIATTTSSNAPTTSSSTPRASISQKSVNSPIPSVSSKRSDHQGLFDVAVDRPTPTLMATATVLYDYTARTDMELSVNKGGLVNVLELDDGSGWVKAELNGLEGLVPAAYLSLDEDESDEEGDSYTLNESIDLGETKDRTEQLINLYIANYPLSFSFSLLMISPSLV
ncbi:hypothetical protein BJ684DRAFT_15348 [Piptocephalis cylindrospora]|uniref:SH3 domain-containing protein n=1 Tax=Piptocephalis cylindrospora TaxID=1907219 RepID=A0A4P9Y5U9_9FUNG|nr:hypothetical protein BJ684DRAFT_15348 [Piptocephalis cylindrospora]|eukprot:RKP14315.1 hypothetical protein BJ684DRAFT_15348 [Piptocephalis cylindrospora]